MKGKHKRKMSLVLALIPILTFSQMEYRRDTTYFQNFDSKVMVVHTTNRQYYKDSACIWEIVYPELHNLGNPSIQSDINLMFSKEVSFGDCNDEVCDRTTMYFPQLTRYWDQVVVTGIRNGLLSYYIYEGSCPTYAKVCFATTKHAMYNLSTGLDIAPQSLFRTDVRSQHILDSIILQKLDFVPEDMEAIRTERQFYFEKNKLMVFYDNYTISKKERHSYELTYKEISPIINPIGPLPAFFDIKPVLKR